MKNYVFYKVRTNSMSDIVVMSDSAPELVEQFLLSLSNVLTFERYYAPSQEEVAHSVYISL